MNDSPSLPDRWPTYDLGPPETRRVIVREEAHLTGKSFRIISLLVVVIGLFVVYFLYSAKIARLASEGVVLQATVDNKHRYQRSKSKETYPAISYTYRYEGFPYSSSEEIDEERYAKTRKGMPVTVTVLREDPHYHWLGTVDEGDVREARIRGSIIVLAIALPFALLGMWSRSWTRANLKRIRTWNVAPAQATAITLIRSPKGAQSYKIDYRVPLPNGEFLLDLSFVGSNLAERTRPGDVFPVLVPPGALDAKSTSMPLFQLENIEVEGEDLGLRDPRSPT